MKSALKFAAVLAAVILLGYLADRVYQSIAGMRADLEAIKAADAKAQAAIAEKEQHILELAAANAALLEKDAAAEATKLQLRRELEASKRDNDKLREDLKTAPPESILADTHRWLNTGEVWLRNNAASQVEAVFSLSAFRLNADALAERQYLKFTLVPSLEADIKLADEELVLRAAMLVNYDIIVTNKDAVILQKDLQLSGRDELLRVTKKRNLWRTLGYVGAGLAAGYVIAHH